MTFPHLNVIIHFHLFGLALFAHRS
jgi:hypothetical protein